MKCKRSGDEDKRDEHLSSAITRCGINGDELEMKEMKMKCKKSGELRIKETSFIEHNHALERKGWNSGEDDESFSHTTTLCGNEAEVR
jgi:hypothetical protein